MIKKLFKFRKYRVLNNWVSIYLFEGDAKRWGLGIVLDETEGVGNPLVAITLIFISIEICKPLYSTKELKEMNVNDDEIEYFL